MIKTSHFSQGKGGPVKTVASFTQFNPVQSKFTEKHTSNMMDQALSRYKALVNLKWLINCIELTFFRRQSKSAGTEMISTNEEITYDPSKGDLFRRRPSSPSVKKGNMD